MLTLLSHVSRQQQRGRTLAVVGQRIHRHVCERDLSLSPVPGL
jgi:hypothetical protein